jgi:serine/threonine protein phosphatase PrpC
MAHSQQRPTPFPPGTRLSDRYAVEGLVRLSEGRMFYLANDDRPDRATRFCWDCEDDTTPRNDHHCHGCGAEMVARRFLISVRWNDAKYPSFRQYIERGLAHPGIVPTLDVFLQDGVMCIVTAWTGDALLIDEGSPLSHEELLQLALRGTGLTAFLQHNGVALSELTLANFVRTRDGTFKLFDVDIAAVQDDKLDPENGASAIPGLANLLRRFTGVAETELQKLFMDAEAGLYPTPMNFGRAVEKGLANGPAEPALEAVSSEAAMSDVGLLRVLNEDNWGWAQLSHDIALYVAADGMGGHECGEIASMMAVETISKVAAERLRQAHTKSIETLENVLDEAFQSANNTIKAHSEEMGNDMGTTLTAAAIYRNELALVANGGDSRAYLMREQVLHQITRDHSLVARMVEQNRLTPEEARNHPHSNILLRTVGTERNVEIDIFSVELEKGDRLILCTDGLWGEIQDEDIEAILNHYADPKVVCREMIRAAHHGGGRDNITVVVVEIT